MLGGFPTTLRPLPFLLLALQLYPSPGWAISHFRLDEAQVSPVGPLARGAFVQMEAGLVAAWAGNLPPDPGERLRADDKTPAGAVVGVALGRLDSGTGLIEIVLH